MLAKRARFNECLEEYYYEKIVLINRCGIRGKKAVDCIIYGIDDRNVHLGAEAARFDCPEKLLPYLKNVKNSNTVNNRKRNISYVTSEVFRPNNTDRIIKCFNCQQEGHYKLQCPKPIFKCIQCSRFKHTVDKCKLNDKTGNKTNKSVMNIDEKKSSAKYYKCALINGKPMKCFIDFGSTATMVDKTTDSIFFPNWNRTDNLPNLKDFGDAIVRPFGEITAELK